MPATPPEATEFPPYYARYVALVGTDDLLAALTGGPDALEALLAGGPPTLGDVSYAPGKWTVKEVLGHLCDTERVFAYRLLRAARGDGTPLPGYDDEAWAAAWDVSGLSVPELLGEFRAVRTASVQLVRHLNAAAWDRTVTANGGVFTVRALAYLIAGHERHHRALLRERYLPG
ncbi:DinB family protein [Deinococcus ficus]|uniref:DinB family protein n=1 Tax=Deinococcus ficus TaxID=317577 RepID=UPI0003B6CF3C|nr:DinB family protein [Deinococcus ficus]